MAVVDQLHGEVRSIPPDDGDIFAAPTATVDGVLLSDKPIDREHHIGQSVSFIMSTTSSSSKIRQGHKTAPPVAVSDADDSSSVANELAPIAHHLISIFMAQSNGLDPSVDHNSNGPEHFLLHHHPTVKSSLSYRRHRQAPHQTIRTTHHDHDVDPTLKPASPLPPIATRVRPRRTCHACLVLIAVRFLCHCPLPPAATCTIACSFSKSATSMDVCSSVTRCQQPTSTTN
ncbi:hypothetical protein ACLOJK_034587 [Asimina triloba]